MREQLSDLRINFEAIELDRKFCEGLGFAYLKSADRAEGHERRDTLRAFAATNFRRAAAHAILFDDSQSATKLFCDASRVYASLRMPYALMMLALAGHPEDSSDIIGKIHENNRPEIDQGSQALEKQWAYTLVFNAAVMHRNHREDSSAVRAFEPMQHKLGAFESSPIGILGLPVGCYIDLAHSLADSRVSYVDEALFPFLSAYNTALRQAGLNSFHWSRLLMPFHPVEPDILSLLVLTHVAFTRRKRRRSVLRLLKKYPLSRSSRAILHGALTQLLPAL
jgi:hypothetical protein